jgi:N-acetylneuraminic acid mutarotase
MIKNLKMRGANLRRLVLLALFPIFILAGFFIFTLSVSAAQYSWEKEPSPIPTIRNSFASVVADNKIFLIGGVDGNNVDLNKIESYNPATDSWQEETPMPEAKWGLSATTIDGKIITIAAGGPVPAGSVRTDEYNPETDTWTQKSDMPAPGWGAVSASANGKIYVMGGYNWSNWGENYNREYNPTTDIWALKAPMPTRRSWLGAEAIDNKIYAVGGWDASDSLDLPTLEVYDPAIDSWETKSPMPIGLRDMATAVLDGKLYVIGGNQGESSSYTPFNKVFSYNPETDIWTEEDNFPILINGCRAETINDTIFVFGGKNYSGFNTDVYYLGPNQFNKHNPAIIVPGIIASYLNNAATGEEIWPNFGDANLQCINSCQSLACKIACFRNCIGGMDNILCSPSDNFLDQLILDYNGSLLENNPVIEATDIFRTITDLAFYAGLIQELENNGYEENQDLFVFSYDWRMNIDWMADNNLMPFSLMQTLKQKISEVKIKTGAEKVDIIAHSMGGLVVKDYIEKNNNESIDKFIDIATPHLGSPLAFKILNYGDDLNICIGKRCFLNIEENKKMSQNMPSVYQLLPSRKYFESAMYTSSAYIYDIIHGNQNAGILNPLDYDQSISFLSDQGRNDFLLGVFGINAINVNDELHSRIDNLPNTDNYYNIIGCGQATYAGIKKKGKKNWALPPLDGDGTVPLKSAESFGVEANKYYTNISEHANLPSADGVRQLAVSILQDKENDFDFSAYQSLSQNQEICGINGVNAGSHSPVELHIYDEEGNHTGPLSDGNIEKGIPGVSYDVLGEDKYAFLPAGRNYRIVNQATSSGELGITLDKIENSQPTGFVYFASIPLNSASTTVEYNITDNQAEYQASIDFDGNGTIDEIVTPDSVLSGEQLNDLTAPQTTISISGQLGNDDYYISDTEISLEATDDNSGILKTEYSLDGGNTWIEYSEEFSVSQSGTTTIIYSSTDRAGNREENKEEIIKIDKIAPEISVLLPQEDQEILRNEKLEIEYFTDDNFSGVATDTVQIYLDEQIINSNTIDLFKQNLGAHQIKIIIQDLAGNQSEQIINFSVINDIDGVITDVNRAYDEGTITKITAKNNLIKDLTDIKKFQEKYGQRVSRRDMIRDKAMAQCLKRKNQTWCEKRIGKIFDVVEYRLSKINQVAIKVKYNLILMKLDLYLRLKWIKLDGYSIIKEDIKYLINNI